MLNEMYSILMRLRAESSVLFVPMIMKARNWNKQIVLIGRAILNGYSPNDCSGLDWSELTSLIIS